MSDREQDFYRFLQNPPPLGGGGWDDMKTTSGIEMELSLKPAAQALFQPSSRQAASSYGDPVNLTNISIKQRFPPQL